MKTIIKLECIGDNTNAMFRGMPLPFEFKVPQPWIAEIICFDLKFKFRRVFLKGTKDYSEANSIGSRGVYLYFYPEYHAIYEIFERISWKNSRRYFCKFDENGKTEITIDEVIKCL